MRPATPTAQSARSSPAIAPEGCDGDARSCCPPARLHLPALARGARGTGAGPLQHGGSTSRLPAGSPRLVRRACCCHIFVFQLHSFYIKASRERSLATNSLRSLEAEALRLLATPGLPAGC